MVVTYDYEILIFYSGYNKGVKCVCAQMYISCDVIGVIKVINFPKKILLLIM